MQKRRGGMLVSRHWLAKSHIPEVLQGVGKRVVSRVSLLPEPVSFRKFLRSKGSEPQEIVRTVFDHVDAQIVARIDAKIRAMRVAQCEASKLDHTIQ